MTCQRVTDMIREAQGAGIRIELKADGNLRLRAPKKPPQSMIEHLRAHKAEIVAFLTAKAEAEQGERRLVANARSSSLSATGFGPNICDRCGKPPTKDNPLIAEGLLGTVHEKCFKGRGRRGLKHAPKTGGGGDAPERPDGQEALQAALMVPVGRKR